MITRSSGRSTLPTCRRSSTRAATTSSQRHVTHPPMSARSTGRVHRSRRTMHKVRDGASTPYSRLDGFVFPHSPATHQFFSPPVPSREASVPWDLPRQLRYRLPGEAAGGQRLYQRAVPSWDAHLHIPAAGPQRVQRGLQELHREGPDRAVHHDGSGAGRWVSQDILYRSTSPATDMNRVTNSYAFHRILYLDYTEMQAQSRTQWGLPVM